MLILPASTWLTDRLADPYSIFEVTWSQFRENLPSSRGPQAAVVIASTAGGAFDLVAIGRYGRHGTSATDRDVAVRLDQIYLLRDPVALLRLVDQMKPSLRNHLQAHLPGGGTVPPATAESFKRALKAFDAGAATHLDRIEARLHALPATGPSAERWAMERDATLLALRIGDFPSDALDDWLPPEPDQPMLAGLLRSQEAAMIDYDASRFPGLRALQQSHVNVHVFADGDRRLEVVNANANGVEWALGTDLLYMNHETKSFVLVQYKKTDQAGDLSIDRRFMDQLNRMDRFVGHSSSTSAPEDYRLADGGAAWVKVVNAEPIRTDRAALLRGMYLTTSYCRLWLADSRTSAARRRVLSIDRVQRYVTNGLFLTLVREGWAGTIGITEQALEQYLRQALRGKRSLVLAEERGEQDAFERRRTTSRKERLRKQEVAQYLLEPAASS